ncbi:MAG: NAD-dependent epimerase/dehydratase family protein [Nocardiaceae bacterium]|nr:NAD-dependent epimerase/dehydratase family protein [Nocardiaceae bacterium]
MSAIDRGFRGQVVMVTGGARHFGGSLVARLAADKRISRVIAIDIKTPSRDLMRRMGRAEFVRADIQNPLIGKVIEANEVDTVVHASVMARPPRGGSRVAMHDVNVFGAMQLFAVCQKAPSVRRVVLRSSSAVYGSSPRDPVQFTEQMGAKSVPKGGFGEDLLDIEGFARSLARRRPDMAVTNLRFAPIIGPQLQGVIPTYLGAPLVPKVVGRDARMQMIHEEDAFAAVAHAIHGGPAGTFNIAGDGVIMMSQAIRRAGRIEAPMPSVLFRTLGRAIMGPVMREFTREQLDYFQYGCGLDTTRMRTVFGFEPRWTTVQAFDDFVRGAALRPVVDVRWIDFAEKGLLALVGTGSGAKG